MEFQRTLKELCVKNVKGNGFDIKKEEEKRKGIQMSVVQQLLPLKIKISLFQA